MERILRKCLRLNREKTEMACLWSSMHGHAKKVEGLSHVRYGKKFLTITNKKLFPLKTITI